MSDLSDRIQQTIETEPVVAFIKGTHEQCMCGNSDRALQQRDMKTFYSLNDRLTVIALDETDVLTELGAYGCDIVFSSVFS